MLHTIIHHVRVFYCTTGIQMLARLAGYSLILGAISTGLDTISNLRLPSIGGLLMSAFGWAFLIFLSRLVINQLSKFESFNNVFFGKDFDWRSAYDGHLDGHSKAEVFDMTEKYKEVKEFNISVGATNDYMYNIGAGDRVGAMRIALNLADSCQNYMISGGIGSGKTVSSISPILYQLLDPSNTNKGQSAGGLVFDIKGDFKGSVYDLASRHNRKDIITIGIGENQTKINIIGGLSPQIASAFLKSCFEQTGGQSSDSFWVDSATDAMKAALTVLQKVEMYTLENLYKMIFDKNIETTVLKAATELAEGDLELIAGLDYYKGVYLKNDEKVLQSIKSTIGTLLSTFSYPKVAETFCNNEAEDADTLFTDVINKGSVLLLDFPLAVHGYGAKAIYVLMKLRFMNLVQTRPTSPEMNQERPIFFVCDEYQNAITSKGFLSDSNFWDKSRSAKCIGVVSFQTISSMYSALKGDRPTTETILANFRQKIFFANEDPSTIEYIQKITGKYDKVRTTTTESTSKQSTDFFDSTSNTGTSTTIVQTQIVGAEDIRSLSQGFTFSVLRVNNQSFLDILTMQYVPTDTNTPAPNPPAKVKLTPQIQLTKEA